MELEFDDAKVRGLRGYVRQVTEELGLSGESSFVQVERPVGAYLALDGRLPGFPDRDVALLWEEDLGWSAAVETHSGEDLLVQAYFGPDTTPSPRAVARWVRELFAGRKRQPFLVPPRRAQEDLTLDAVPQAVPLPRSA
ncbi:DUF6292 family protein [Saccharothrix coeruleofusca]|uniref:DUF6292 domain-containing protein n=1 Tax=Saccharothrix coeruleofusca TaxID=33919 RepID=A0A918AQE3_9PSEU|nr:DUF6292 family protein [Saccharothrix coeruleofusca]MBP2335040.1 hypothetical protein [Saccharothrix coeruleofusca]GGP68763.1 hypothetical protein GCM10010185_47120 [Saccharothrix coeruleofusca]